jgi:hypothetical protein
MEPEGSSPYTQKSSPPVPILSQTDPVYAPHSTSRRSILILFSHVIIKVLQKLLMWNESWLLGFKDSL